MSSDGSAGDIGPRKRKSHTGLLVVLGACVGLMLLVGWCGFSLFKGLVGINERIDSRATSIPLAEISFLFDWEVACLGAPGTDMRRYFAADSDDEPLVVGEGSWGLLLTTTSGSSHQSIISAGYPGMQVDITKNPCARGPDATLYLDYDDQGPTRIWIGGGNQ